VLVRNGPSGGNLKDVVMAKKIIAGTDPVAVDSYACTLDAFKKKAEDIIHIKTAYERGMGEIDLEKVEILTKKL
jgi:uncharacterized protein (DUF362 family)